MTDLDQPPSSPSTPQRRRYPRGIRTVVDVGRDLGLAALTFVFGILAVVTPRRSHRPIVRAAAGLGTILGGGSRRRLIVEQSFCRGYGVFRRGWPAEVRVTGLEHVRAAHAEGRGVVMWVMGFLDQTALTLALDEAGYPVTFLSAQNHGIYSSRAPSRHLAAPILIRGAIRAHDRVVIIPDNGNKSYVKQLCSVLEQQNGTVGMKGDVTDHRGSLEAPYRGHRARFPTGAPSLAFMTGSSLVTGAVLRHGTLEHEVVIDEPISVPRDSGRRQYLHGVVEEFAQRLERRVTAHPDSRPATKFDKVLPT